MILLSVLQSCTSRPLRVKSIPTQDIKADEDKRKVVISEKRIAFTNTCAEESILPFDFIDFAASIYLLLFIIIRAAQL